ncbi:hypothetical protein [Mycobacterium paragordonae]|nr:hypothetical protein [Mycobacterium paragordonae]
MRNGASTARAGAYVWTIPWAEMMDPVPEGNLQLILVLVEAGDQATSNG